MCCGDSLLTQTCDGLNQIIWTPLEPKQQQPQKKSPMARFGHAAQFSSVCSLGYTIEEGVRSGRIVLETLLVRVFSLDPPQTVLSLCSPLSRIASLDRVRILFQDGFFGSRRAFDSKLT